MRGGTSSPPIEHVALIVADEVQGQPFGFGSDTERIEGPKGGGFSVAPLHVDSDVAGVGGLNGADVGLIPGKGDLEFFVKDSEHQLGRTLHGGRGDCEFQFCGAIAVKEDRVNRLWIAPSQSSTTASEPLVAGLGRGFVGVARKRDAPVFCVGGPNEGRDAKSHECEPFQHEILLPRARGNGNPGGREELDIVSYRE